MGEVEVIEWLIDKFSVVKINEEFFEIMKCL